MENKTFKIGDIINVMSWGEPKQDQIIEWSEEHKKFKIGHLSGGMGSYWLSESEIIEQQKRVDEYHKEKIQERFNFWQNGGDNGPTGHGPDICMSDAEGNL